MKRLAPLALVALALAACGGDELEPSAAPETTAPVTTQAAPPSPPPAATAPQPLPGLPAWTAGYRRWTKLTKTPLPPRDADPHLGTKTVYASKAAGNAFPPGTVIVKEALRPGRDFVGLIATMRKVKGADPEHGDWVFVEWARDSPDARSRSWLATPSAGRAT